MVEDARREIQSERLKRIREQEEEARKRISKIKYKIAVISGKGGVGKSFITANLGLALAYLGKRVVILDADIHGPSIPKLLGLHGRSMSVGANGLIPLTADLGVKVVSVDFLLPSEESALIWRGPMKTSLIRELLAKVDWGEQDFMLIDLPPGTGDEPLTVVQLINDIDGAVIVTIPSDLSRIVVKKAVTFCRKLNVPILGVIENMSGFTCPESGKTYYVMGRGAGRKISKEMNVRFLGEIPLDPRISETIDEGKPFFSTYLNIEAAKRILDIAKILIDMVESKNRET